MSAGLGSMIHTQKRSENVFWTIIQLYHWSLYWRDRRWKHFKVFGFPFVFLLIMLFLRIILILCICVCFHPIHFHSLPSLPSSIFIKFYPFHGMSVIIPYFLQGFLDIFSLYLTHFLFKLVYVDFFGTNFIQHSKIVLQMHVLIFSPKSFMWQCTWEHWRLDIFFSCM